MKSILITTAAALFGSLAVLTTGCETGMPMRQTGMNNKMMMGGRPYAMSNTTISPRTAQMIRHRAAMYKSKLTLKQRMLLKRHNVRYFAVDCPTLRNRGHGVPVVLYDIYTGQLMNRRVVTLNTAPASGRIININGWPTKYICGGSPMMGSQPTMMNTPLFGSRM